MSFKKNKYKIVKNAIPESVALFLFDYLHLKRQVFRTLKDTTYISKHDDDWGKSGDEQCPKSYSVYSDTAMETVLDLLTEKMNKQTGFKLSPTYSYARLYEKGAELEKHTDRYSCKGKDIEVKLNPSDMLIYSGCELPHWRNKFEGELCGQVFLHYNDMSNSKWEDNKYDNRPHLGLPSWFKGKKLL
jgi:hypothetical protein